MIKTALKAFFGGGSTYFYLLIGGVIIALYGYVSFLEARLDKVILERDTAIAESQARGSIVNSQNRQAKNETTQKQEAKNGKDEVAIATDPVNYAYDWVRKRREAQRNPNE